MPKWKDLTLSAWRMWRVLDWRPIRREAETVPQLALLGSGPVLDRIALLFEQGEVRRGPIGLPIDDPPPDLVVLDVSTDPARLDVVSTQARALQDRDVAALLLVPPGAQPSEADLAFLAVDPAALPTDERLGLALIDALPDQRRLGAARHAPALRAPLARLLIHESSFANAQFALMTNLPTFLPGVGGATAVGADMLVLTTNQVVLVFKLAALWGASLDNPRALIAEAAPVVGGAFFWRTAARTLIDLLPGFAVLAPKVGIAYIGTYVVGALASAYYQSGVRPSDARVREIEAEARAALAQAWRRLRPASAPAPDAASASALPPPAAPRTIPVTARPPAAPPPAS
ncbi:MAG TPA: hypothetical protein VFE37_28805 [Chloroflexota bacterium]|nr:hypothetical protein [Chloroflexota bacterium]